MTFNCDEIWWGVSCAVLTANLLPVVRYVPTFHPSVANELINLLLAPSSSSSEHHLLSPSQLRELQLAGCLTRSPAGSNKTKEGNFDKKILKKFKVFFVCFPQNVTRQSG